MRLSGSTAMACSGWLTLFIGCGSSQRAPFMVAGADSARSTDGVLEVSWSTTSCDQAGYLTIMTSDGTFLGNVWTGTKIRAALPPGDVELIAWNPREYAEGVPHRPYAVIARGRVCPNAVSRVRVRSTEWTRTGPGRVFSRRGNLLCTGHWALVNDERPDIDLALFHPDREHGQSWLTAHKATRHQKSIAEAWHARLSTEGRKLVTFGCEAAHN
jgi:hypothetical protein